MSEKIPATIDTPEIATPTADELAAMLTVGSVEHPLGAREANPEATGSSTAAFLRSSVERVAGFLDRRAETADDRREARSERFDRAKQATREFGQKALHTSREVALTATSVTFLVAEASANGVRTTRGKIVGFAAQARTRMEERRTNAENARQARNEIVINQNDAFDTYTQNISATAERERREEIDTAHAEALVIDEQRDIDQINAEGAAERARQEAEERARLAMKRRAARRERVTMTLERARDTGSELWTAAKTKTRSFGRAALRFMKRTGRAVKAGASAAVKGTAQGWKQA